MEPSEGPLPDRGLEAESKAEVGAGQQGGKVVMAAPGRGEPRRRRRGEVAAPGPSWLREGQSLKATPYPRPVPMPTRGLPRGP